MAIADLVSQQLPFMRRYARAATGDLNSGDDAVESALEELIKLEFDVAFPAHAVDKIYLFGLLEKQLDERLSSNDDERSRRAVLLTAMEGFPSGAASKIMQVTQEELQRLMILAERNLVDALATRMLIIEDEPLIASHIKQISESIGHRVIGIASTAKEAVELYRQEKPDIVLSDIQLADQSLGTDAIDAMELPETVPVIFITAYPEKLLRDKAEGPTYLITKPFKTDYVKAVISHALIRADRKKAELASS